MTRRGAVGNVLMVTTDAVESHNLISPPKVVLLHSFSPTPTMKVYYFSFTIYLYNFYDFPRIILTIHLQLQSLYPQATLIKHFWVVLLGQAALGLHHQFIRPGIEGSLLWAAIIKLVVWEAWVTRKSLPPFPLEDHRSCWSRLQFNSHSCRRRVSLLYSRLLLWLPIL